MTDEAATPPPMPVTGAPPKKRSFWRSPLGILAIIGLIIGTIVLATLVTFGLGVQFGYLPDTAALSGKRLQDRVVTKLRNADIIAADEKVHYYYSAGLFDHLEDGNLFTDRRVISYWQIDGELEIDSVKYTEIEEINVKWTDNWLEDTEITVHRGDGTAVILIVSNESGGDRKFHTELERIWKERR